VGMWELEVAYSGNVGTRGSLPWECRNTMWTSILNLTSTESCAQLLRQIVLYLSQSAHKVPMRKGDNWLL